MKTFIIFLIILVIIGIGGYMLFWSPSDNIVVENQDMTDDSSSEQDMHDGDQTSEVQDGEQADESMSVIGTSGEGRDITAYHYGAGDTELLFVGGIHGGYEWNTVLLAYEMMDYFEQQPNIIPDNVRVTVIPVLNPDGLNKVVGSDGRFTYADVSSVKEETIPGRFNAHDVDLNRNFDCDWNETGTWQNKPVSGGTKAFSEPESMAIKTYIETNMPDAVVVWYSAAGGVFASSCHNGVSDETRALTNTYAHASGYPAYEEFDFYSITGDMVNWFAKKDIPAISVLLTNHEDVEFEKNKAGVSALLEQYAQ